MAKFLLIDDDADEFFFMKIAAKAIPDVECHYAQGGEEAFSKLEKMQDHLPDVIFLDVNMPLMPGHTCLQILKQSPAFHKIQVVIYTTADLRDQVEHWDELGADYFLRKLFPLDLIPVLKFFFSLPTSSEEQALVESKLVKLKPL